jgi:hypothetical protein
MLRRSRAGARAAAATDLEGAGARRRIVRHLRLVPIVVAALTGCCGAATPTPTELPPTALPFLGVACPRPNSIACDRVGIGVHMDGGHPTAVIVQVAGRLIRLSPPLDPPDDVWLGYLPDAGLRHGALDVHLTQREQLWLGSPEVFARVRVTAFFANGTARTLAADDLLHPGFG